MPEPTPVISATLRSNIPAISSLLVSLPATFIVLAISTALFVQNTFARIGYTDQIIEHIGTVVYDETMAYEFRRDGPHHAQVESRPFCSASAEAALSDHARRIW
jgi:hypothetical protein